MYKGAPPLAAVRLYGITITGVSCMCVIHRGREPGGAEGA